MKKSKKIEIISITIFYILLVFGVLLLTGTITSGWHLVDDQEYIDYILQMKFDGLSYWECLKNTILQDLMWRFRPLYYFLRVTFTVFFGTNLVAWSLLRGFTTAAAFLFLYLCGRKMKCNIFYSVLFSLVVMVGPQSVVWWKLGPQEGTGMLIFAIGFYFLLLWLESGKKCYKWNAVITLILVGLYKESFLLMLPFALSYLFYYDFKNEGFSFTTIKKVFIKNKAIIISLIAFLCIALAVIFKYSGTNVAYLGEEFTPNRYKILWIGMLQNSLEGFFWCAAAVFLIMLTGIKKWNELFWEFLLTIAIMAAQFILYIRLGFEERYILPWSFGYAYFMVIALSNWSIMQGIRRKIYCVCLAGLIIFHFPIVIKEAEYYTYRGQSVTDVFNTVLEETEPDSKILAAYWPYEESNITASYWMRLNGRDNVYSWNEDNKECIDITGEGKGTKEELQNMEYILFYNPKDRHYCGEPDMDFSNYNKEECGTLVIYRKR